MPILLVVLQNAYAKTAKRERQLKKYDLYLKALWASHTGRRLLEMLPDGWDVHIINASPKIGRKPSSVFRPDVMHVKRMFEQTQPDVVLGCGRTAHSALNSLGISYIAAPHPAWRLLSKGITANIKRAIMEEFN